MMGETNEYRIFKKLDGTQEVQFRPLQGRGPTDWQKAELPVVNEPAIPKLAIFTARCVRTRYDHVNNEGEIDFKNVKIDGFSDLCGKNWEVTCREILE